MAFSLFLCPLSAQEPTKTLIGSPSLALSPVGQNQPPISPFNPSRDQIPQPRSDLRQDQPPPGLGFDASGNWRPPSANELFRVENEQALFERIRQEKRGEGEFPAEQPITGTLLPRTFSATVATEFPPYVVYQPLYFQQINAERYGWELGVFQPIVSTAQFYGDVLLFPYKVAVDPPWKCEANRGYALPGDAEPLRFLTMPFSWRGVAAEAGAAVGASAIFP